MTRADTAGVEGQSITDCRSDRRSATRENTAAILMYHRVAELSPDTYNLCVRPADFRDHVAHLRQHYEPMSLDDLLIASRSDRLPERAVVLTFDDGYLDALEHASPILSEFDVPATFFINTNRLAEVHEFWWDTLERIFLSGLPVPAAMDLADTSGLSLPTVTTVERQAAHETIRRRLYSASARERDEQLQHVIEWSGLELPPRQSHRPLLADEVRQLAQRPRHSIGAHTTNHLSLPSQSEHVQRVEILESKERLEAIAALPITSFSYPYGEFDNVTADLVRTAGFTCAVTVQPAMVSAGTDPFRFPRFEIRGVPVGEFAATLDCIFAATDHGFTAG
jgi:peptidoglycan/xylan/chitin deacetylase (PgdA/CDA1 family)